MKRVFGCDPKKRAMLLNERGLDLLDMGAVFEDHRRIDLADHRFDHGEERRVTIGRVCGRTFTLVYTMRGSMTWLITAWPSNKRERARYGR
jgi:uncharacterized DUF497 family protein